MKKLLILLTILMSLSIFAEDTKKEDTTKIVKPIVSNEKSTSSDSKEGINKDVKKEKKDQKEVKKETKKTNYSFFKKKKEKKVNTSITLSDQKVKRRKKKKAFKKSNTIGKSSYFVTKKKKKEKSLSEQLSWLGKKGLRKDGFLVFGGMHKHLYTYTDRRYAGYDQGDYITSQAFLLGLEYWQTDLSSVIPSLQDVKFGTTFAFYNRAEFENKKLRAVDYTDRDTDFHIDEESVPGSQLEKTGHSWINVGFFGGIDKKWIGFDLGLTLSVSMYDDKEIREYKDGEKQDGKGYVYGDMTVYPNVHLRLGREESAYFVFNVLREDYDPIYGVINMYVHFPMSSFFSLSVGGYTYQTDAIFIQPTLQFGEFKAALKLGTIINYQENHLNKVGIVDSLFTNLSIKYEW